MGETTIRLRSVTSRSEKGRNSGASSVVNAVAASLQCNRPRLSVAERRSMQEKRPRLRSLQCARATIPVGSPTSGALAEGRHLVSADDATIPNE